MTTRSGAAPAASLGGLPDAGAEAALFWRVRKQEAWAHLRLLATEARLRTILVVVLSIGFWVGLFALFHLGFSFLQVTAATIDAEQQTRTVKFVFHLFFASLNVMLVFSSAIILYAGLYSSAETRFLLTTPARPERIVLHRFQEAVLFSSWGFFLLASPLTLAYGVSVAAPWHYYVLVTPLIVAFVCVPCALGAIACLLLIDKLAQVRITLVAILAAVSLGFAAWSVWDVFRVSEEELVSPGFVDETLSRFAFTREEWLPSAWLSNALIEAARTPPAVALPLDQTPVVRTLLYLGLLVSNALMGRLLLIAVARRCFRRSFSSLECRPRSARRARVAWADRFALWALRLLPTQVRLLLVKDWRLLRRDPVQWSQFLIFFGLLGLYFLNVDRFKLASNQMAGEVWVNLVSFLNLAVVGLILSTFTTRFIYPMLSLEGRRFWVLGLMPIDRDTIVWSKFAFASLGSWGPCALLILISDVMLGVGPTVLAMHQFTTALLCFGLSALAVGLGAAMPNFRETSPSKIAAGFGGTLTLVLSAMYIIVVVALTALPSHFMLIASGSTLVPRQYVDWWLYGGLAVSVFVGVLATVAPLRIGLRSFRRLEFR